MRHAVLLSLLAAPALAAVQAPAVGTITFTDGMDDPVHGRWISLAECLDRSASVNVSWNTRPLSGVTTLPVDAVSELYASNTPAAGDECRMGSDAVTGVTATVVGPAVTGAGQVVELQPRWIGTMLEGAGITDCSVSADTPVYLCVQTFAFTPVQTLIGIATGTMTLSVSAPAAPTDVSVTPGESGALLISWTAASSFPAAYDFRVVATAADPSRDPFVHEVTTVLALATRMSGLVNGVPYAVQVYARSQAGNESAPAAPVIGTPSAPTTGPRLTRPSGDGSGGCATGTAGPVALLGVAALLARVRRRPRGR